MIIDDIDGGAAFDDLGVVIEAADGNSIVGKQEPRSLTVVQKCSASKR